MRRGAFIGTWVAVAATLVGLPAHADGPPATVRADVTTEGSAPNSYMLGAGIGVLGLSYGSAVVVGATSARTGDQTLFVPIVGPWFDLANRPACGIGVTYNDENTAKVLLVTDGVFQAIGALSIVGAFLSPERKEVHTVRSASVRLVPAYLGARGSGLLAVGTF
jgi:hypothetical protein